MHARMPICQRQQTFQLMLVLATVCTSTVMCLHAALSGRQQQPDRAECSARTPLQCCNVKADCTLMVLRAADSMQRSFRQRLC